MMLLTLIFATKLLLDGADIIILNYLNHLLVPTTGQSVHNYPGAYQLVTVEIQTQSIPTSHVITASQVNQL